MRPYLSGRDVFNRVLPSEDRTFITKLSDTFLLHVIPTTCFPCVLHTTPVSVQSTCLPPPLPPPHLSVAHLPSRLAYTQSDVVAARLLSDQNQSQWEATYLGLGYSSVGLLSLQILLLFSGYTAFRPGLQVRPGSGVSIPGCIFLD